MSAAVTVGPCEAARRVAAICRLPEAEAVHRRVAESVPHPPQADVLWLTWLQWRALGREALSRETGLSPFVITDRLRRLRDLGAPVLSSAEERERLARGRFHGTWD